MEQWMEELYIAEWALLLGYLILLNLQLCPKANKLRLKKGYNLLISYFF